MSYLDFLAGWWSGWCTDRHSSVQLELRVGTSRGLNDASTLAAESSATLGSLTVWADGSLEVEVMRLSDEGRVHVYSGVLAGPEDFASQLSAFIRACEFPPGRDQS